MRSDTQAITIGSTPEGVLGFIADPENLPRWAIGFAKAARRDGSNWIVETGQGPVPVRIEADTRTGVVDFHMRIQPDAEVTAFSRVTPNGAGTEYVFTQVQAPDMPGEVFEAQVRALGHELTALKAILEVDCPL
jgi:hypothetical protein